MVHKLIKFLLNFDNMTLVGLSGVFCQIRLAWWQDKLIGQVSKNIFLCFHDSPSFQINLNPLPS